MNQSSGGSAFSVDFGWLGSGGQKYLHLLRTGFVTHSLDIGKPAEVLQAASLFEDGFYLLFFEAAAMGDCVNCRCKCRVVFVFVFSVFMFRFEEGAVMGHMVRYEEGAAGLEEGGEDASDVVYVGKVVVGLRALWENREEVKIGYLEVRRRGGRTTMISNVLPPS
jgi:hypothetical protein